MASNHLPFPKSDDEREHERLPVAIGASVRELRAAAHTARVVDLTVAGCRVSGSDLRQNDEIWIRIGTAKPIRARVIWAAKGEFGCSFYHPLLRSELHNIQAARPTQSRRLFAPASTGRGSRF